MTWVNVGIAAVGIATSLYGSEKKSKAEKAEGRDQAAAMIRQGEAERDAGIATEKAMQFEADQFDYMAGQERASSQRAAVEERRRIRLMESRAIALSAAGGTKVSDPGVVNILADLEAEGEYAALSALYEGHTTARSMELTATLRRFEGAEAKRAGEFAFESAKRGAGSVISASKKRSTATLIGGAGSAIGKSASLYDRYGPVKSDGLSYIDKSTLPTRR